MSSAERFALKSWLWLTLAAAFAVFAYAGVTLVMMFLVTIPLVLLIEVTPTIWIYLTLAGIVYVPLRWALRNRSIPRWCLAAIGATAAIATGTLIPALANREIDHRVDAMMKNDMGEEPLLPPAKSIALLSDGDLGEGKCWAECQRLLFSGLTTAVLQTSTAALSDPSRSPVRVVRHRIVPMSAGCENRLLLAARADDSELNGARTRWLWDKLQDLARAGKCFRSDWSQDARADVYFVQTGYDSPPGQQTFDLRFMPIDTPRRRIILRRENGKLVPMMRRTRVSFSHLAIPLRFEPPFEFDIFTPGKWSRVDALEKGREPRADLLHEWVKNDLRIHFDSPPNTP